MPESPPEPLTVRAAALALLARREYTFVELHRKLCQRFPSALVEQSLVTLRQAALQSDRRFTEAYVYQWQQKGYGPVRITVALQQKGIDRALLADCVPAHDAPWLPIAAAAVAKKFGPMPPATLKDKAQRYRFLTYRGFTPEQIRQVLDV